MTDSHGWTDYPASFALGVLDEEERVEFEAHLADCEACRSAVQAFRETAATLAWSVPQRVPPASLRARVLHEAAAVRPIATPARTRRAGAGSDDLGADFGRRSGPRLAGAARTWLAAASLVLAVGAAALFVRERGARSGLEAAVARMQDEAARTAARLGELASDVAARDSLLASVLSPDTRTVRLTAQGRPPSAQIFWSQARGRVVIAAFDLDPAPAGRTYQLWGIAGGSAPVSLGIFNTSADGRTVAAFEVGPGARFDVAAITEEPAGGSPQPTTTPFLVGGIGL